MRGVGRTTRTVYNMASSTVKTTNKVIRSFIAEGEDARLEERREWRSVSCRRTLKLGVKNVTPRGSRSHTWRLVPGSVAGH